MLQKVAERLMQVQQDLDELTVQLALGKAEAREKFEEVKHDFRLRLVQIKHKAVSALLTDSAERMQGTFEELEVQLALGKAESKEVFEDQVKKINQSLHDLELAIRNKLPQGVNTDSFLHDIESFKLKMEIIRLKFELKRFEVKDAFKEKMLEIRKSVHALKAKGEEALQGGEERIEEWKEEVQNVYSNFRKAIKEL